MVAAVESMAYAGQVPWHGLGNKVEGMTPKQMLKAAGLDWSVSKRPIYYEKGGRKVEVDDQYVLARDTDDQFLTITGKKYKEIQNAQIFEFMEEYCHAAGMTMETAGSLWDGRYIWALAKVSDGFKVGRGDEVNDYVLISQPHVIGKACVMKWTGVRVVCWNTLSMALGTTAMGERTDEFRVPHSIAFSKEVQEQAAMTLKLAKAQTHEFKEAAQFLAKHRATAEQVDAFFGSILHFDGSKQVTASGREKATPRMLLMFQDALEKAPGANLATAAGTWWGALNAVTYVVDHERGNSRDTGLRSAWLGDGAVLKQDALQTALKMAS